MANKPKKEFVLHDRRTTVHPMKPRGMPMPEKVQLYGRLTTINTPNRLGGWRDRPDLASPEAKVTPEEVVTWSDIQEAREQRVRAAKEAAILGVRDGLVQGTLAETLLGLSD